MKNTGIYVLATCLLIAIAALGVAAKGAVSGLPDPMLGTVKYIWAGAAIALLALISFFVWLIGKGK